MVVKKPGHETNHTSPDSAVLSLSTPCKLRQVSTSVVSRTFLIYIWEVQGSNVDMGTRDIYKFLASFLSLSK
jgi:hypothetical protein